MIDDQRLQIRRKLREVRIRDLRRHGCSELWVGAWSTLRLRRPRRCPLWGESCGSGAAIVRVVSRQEMAVAWSSEKQNVPSLTGAVRIEPTSSERAFDRSGTRTFSLTSNADCPTWKLG